MLVADLAGPEELTGAVARVLDAFGRVDVLVNAAGTDVVTYAPGRVFGATVS